MTNIACGIDIGGSGIKGALVDLTSGEFIGERVRIETPHPATPEAVAKTCVEVLSQLQAPADVPVGIAMPAPLPQGIVPFMANLDASWEGVHAQSMYESFLGHPVTVLNDADAAGLAEAVFGAAQGQDGLVIVTTLGTGIGSALIYRGVLIPNSELGHLEIGGYDAESRASAAQRVKQDLGWKKWAKRLQKYYSHVEMLFSPDLFVVGGGVSKNSDKFLPLLSLRTPIIPAQLRNRAGIVGAAVAADRANQ
ncbi:polyphosphate--glucose phosphotransferase [Scrofimicrobium sp. R131]|uniref:ROK family protein n=1 Tax=Scrofimicrobium appendicitidis TaxID=3079930 RepID=A0AAU7V9Y8_9ACTO